ncbi:MULTISPECIES: 4-hydroxy-tetrahydrodipicolinate reductase [unclassified Microbacterium]|uniref:4-hydroxy-tetrahydrodipicolinate reductase n=1 Tax=unclassified Microbacterium TaxID=2609290 RepID=UPI000B3541A9|nr:4-hydroxy-tetrahydrodipicolinate reductase [Microbacterium sp. JB110]RCS59091.1 4-hydroxy-tetrahydrodipicolinate reductase [Microbacterium sp. JB110]
MASRVALVGGNGKLGSIIRQVIEEHDDFDVHSVLGSGSDLAEIEGADLVVDASVPQISVDVVRAATQRGLPVLVGTSGWSSERIASVRPLVEAAGTAAVFIPNFSLGSVLGTALAAAASRFFPYAEIVEAHRDTKIDSPSGTAVRTAEMIASARDEPVEAPHVDQRARGQQVGGVPVHALRRPGVVARQETILSGHGESLSVVHDTIESAAAYAPGIRIALEHTPRVRGVVVGLENFIDIGIGAPRASARPPVDEGGVTGQVAGATGA